MIGTALARLLGFVALCALIVAVGYLRVRMGGC